MFKLVSIVHIFICSMLVAIVLLQQGRGADAGATFGGGGNTLFGAGGADSFLTRLTTFVALCFMLTSVYLAFGSREASVSRGTAFENLPASAPIVLPSESGRLAPEAEPATTTPDANGTVLEQNTVEENTTAPQAVSPEATDSEATGAATSAVPVEPAAQQAEPAAPQ